MDNERMDNLQDVTQTVDTSDGLSAGPMPRRFWKNPRGIALFVAFVLLFSAIGGYTVAYLQMKAEKDVRNDFRLAQVDVVSNITQTISGMTRTLNNLNFTNKQDVDGDGAADSVSVYIRVAVLGNWVLGTNAKTIYGASHPERGTDYYLQYNGVNDSTTAYNGYNTSGWFMVQENGVTYYYHKAAVKPDAKTSDLATSCVINSTNAPSGYSCSVEFAVQAIQAVGKTKDGKDPVTEAWGISVSNGILQNPSGS